MKTVLFMLSRNPYSYQGGDTRLSRLVMDILREGFSVRGVALSNTPSGRGDLAVVPKPGISAAKLVINSMKTNRSLLHCRYDTSELRRAIGESRADMFVAEHSYMAESYLSSSRREQSELELFVNTHVSEHPVWCQRRPPVKWTEPRRIRSDELRVARKASRVACYDGDEAGDLAAQGARAREIILSLPPASERSRPELAGPRLLFLGDRTWGPNREAFEEAVRLWPSIRRFVPDAELWVAGRSSTQQVGGIDGVQDLGFVENLSSVMSCVRGLLAPVITGGGVRVKILEAAVIGLPVVCSPTALGNLGEIFPIHPNRSDEEFVAECERLLRDDAYAEHVSTDLYESNRSRWDSCVPHQNLMSWLGEGTGQDRNRVSNND